MSESRPKLWVRCSAWTWWPLVFDGDEVLIGRASSGPTADLACLRLRDANLSRRHASLVLSSGGVWAIDIGSTGGIELHGRRVTRAPLAPPDVLRVCDHTFSAWVAPCADDPQALAQASDPRSPPSLLDALARRSMALALRVAENASTPPALLDQLRPCPALAIPHALATNPSLPLPHLHQLWNRFPLTMAQNAAFPLACLADPTLAFLTEQAATWLLGHRPPDPFFATALASHPSGSVRILARAVRSPG